MSATSGSKSLAASTLQRARDMRSGGAKWPSISISLGVSIERLRRALDPGYAERRNSRTRQYRRIQPRGDVLSAGNVARGMPIEEMQRLLATVPRDTRDLTGRVLGDPLPGRSALDQQPRAAMPEVSGPGIIPVINTRAFSVSGNSHKPVAAPRSPAQKQDYAHG